MRDIDLGPNNYRKQIRGRWQLPNDPKLARNMLAVVSSVLVFIFVGKDSLTSGTLFGVTGMFAFCGGIMLAMWLRD